MLPVGEANTAVANERTTRTQALKTSHADTPSHRFDLVFAITHPPPGTIGGEPIPAGELCQARILLLSKLFRTPTAGRPRLRDEITRTPGARVLVWGGADLGRRAYRATPRLPRARAPRTSAALGA